jgi:hypothetical protein
MYFLGLCKGYIGELNFDDYYIQIKDKHKILLDQKRKEITSLLESKLINVETFRLLNEYIKNLTDGISK